MAKRHFVVHVGIVLPAAGTHRKFFHRFQHSFEQRVFSRFFLGDLVPGFKLRLQDGVRFFVELDTALLQLDVVL